MIFTKTNDNIEILEEEDAVSQAFVELPVRTLPGLLEDAESFVPPSETLKKPPITVLEYGSFKFNAYGAARTAFWSLALALLLGFVITRTTNVTTNRRRRRRKTELCVSACLKIVGDAAEDIDFIFNRALESEDGARAPRKTRKYKTRR